MGQNKVQALSAAVQTHLSSKHRADKTHSKHLIKHSMEEGTGCKQRELVSGGKRPPGAPQSENIAYREVKHEFKLTKKNLFKHKTHRG